MRKLLIGFAAVAAMAFITASGWTQPPEGKAKGSKDGAGKFDKGGAGRFQVGRVLPPGMREQLNLTDEQKKALDDLEKDVKDRLAKILTEEQRKKLEQTSGPGNPKGGPPGGNDSKPGDRPKGKGKGKDESPPTAAGTPSTSGVQWFATLERGRAEAERTGQPILFLAAAPHCGGISGIW